MNDRTPWAYRALYSRGTAAGLVLMSGAVLAVSQTHVIRDWLAVLHPGWSRPWLWANAAGFELVVLAVGLVLAATGQRSLWVAEVFLIAVSCGAAWDSAPDGTPLVREILGSLMPLQYLAAVLAGHRLYHHHQGSETRAIGAPGDETVAGLLAAELGHATPVDETPGRLLDETLTRLSGQFGLASPGWDDPREWRDEEPPRAPARRSPDSEAGRAPKRPARPLTNRPIIVSGSSAEHLLAFLQQRGGSASVAEAHNARVVSRAQLYRIAARDPRFTVVSGMVSLAETAPA